MKYLNLSKYSPKSKLSTAGSRGVSYVEMVIYVAILAVLFVLVINIATSMLSSYRQIKLSKNITIASVTLMERLVREIQNAKSVDQVGSVLGTNPGKLVLNTTDSAGTPKVVEFYRSDLTLRVKEDAVDVGPLTASDDSVDSIIFRLIDTGFSEAVKIEVTLSSSLGSASTTKIFYDTVILRGSYSN